MAQDTPSRWTTNPSTPQRYPEAELDSRPYLRNYAYVPAGGGGGENSWARESTTTFTIGTDGSDDVMMRNTCSRWMVVVVSVVTLLVGLGAMIASLLGAVSGCNDCGNVLTQQLVASGVIVAVGAVGAGAAIVRRVPCAVAFAVMITCLAFIFLAGAVILVHESWTHSLWTWMVEHDDSAICALQQRLDCSGFSACCAGFRSNSNDGTGSSPCATSNVSLATECAASCVTTNARATRACGEEFRGGPLLYSAYGAFGLVALMFGGAVWAARMVARDGSAHHDFDADATTDIFAP